MRPAISSRPLLTHDVRFEGWTTEDWLRFLRLWQPRAAPEKEPTRPRGGVVVVHEDGEVLKLLHTRLGRLDPAAAAPPPEPGRAPGRSPSARATRRPSGTLARAHHASWALSMRLGALDEVMERLGARVRRGDDLTAQSLLLVSIVRDMIAEGAIASWPQRLRGIPVPDPAGRAPDARRALRRRARHRARALRRRRSVDGVRRAPPRARVRRRRRSRRAAAGARLALGRLAPRLPPPRADRRGALRAARLRLLRGARDVPRAADRRARRGVEPRGRRPRRRHRARCPPRSGVALGFDGARYAMEGLQAADRPHRAARRHRPDARRRALARRADAPDKDVGALLGFDPLAALRALLQR